MQIDRFQEIILLLIHSYAIYIPIILYRNSLVNNYSYNCLNLVKE